ncbi:MAG TPA: hypothetical protein VKA19_02255 [Alphaproteobacteria bacterium]|nr:hypothetical protein [Alphaproteobacteria bacterium]
MGINTNKYIKMGAGKVYFAPYDSSGNKTGNFRYLGETESLSYTASPETKEKKTSDSAVATTAKKILTGMSRSGKLVCDEVAPENLAMFVIGAASTHTQASATGSTETLTSVSPGTMRIVGATASNPIGVRDISNVTVTGGGGSPSYTEGTDYTLDLTAGTITVLENGNISDGDDLDLTYDVASKSWDHIESSNTKQVKGELVFIGDYTTGENDDQYFPNVDLQPSGDFNIKSRQDFQQIEFDMSIMEPSSGEEMYIDTQAV